MTIDDTEASVRSTLREFSKDLSVESTRPAWIDRLNAAAREAPLEMLGMAFLIGVLLGRRRR
jgi:hypothetical protein